MEGPTRPDLRDAGRYVRGFEDRSRRVAGPTVSRPPPFSTKDGLIGVTSPRQPVRYTDLLRSLDAIGATIDHLNRQVRALLTHVGYALAQDAPERELD
jgi:hypothetical protein